MPTVGPPLAGLFLSVQMCYPSGMVDVLSNRLGTIDLSFIASLECDLACAHCMYDSSPRNKSRLNYERVRGWISTVDWDDIHACGFYGGEPALLLEWYERFIFLVPERIPKFIITNGTWSKDTKRTEEFLSFVDKHAMKVVVSGTKWHTGFQDVDVLLRLKEQEKIIYKGEETQIIPMGRASLWMGNKCTTLCQRWNKPWRIAIHPTKDIIFQSCDGSYPKLQTLDEPFGAVEGNIRQLLTNVRLNNETRCAGHMA